MGHFAQFVVPSDDAEHSWTIDAEKFKGIVKAARESAPGPDGIPASAYRCANYAGSDILYEIYREYINGAHVPEEHLKSILAFIVKSAPESADSLNVAAPIAESNHSASHSVQPS